METLLEVQNLVKFYGNKTSLTKAVNDISFQVNKGEFTAIMGGQRLWKNNTFKLYFYY